jgi:hypothetical protein
LIVDAGTEPGNLPLLGFVLQRLFDLVARIVASGDGILEQEYDRVWFPGDDLLAACRSAT